MPSSRCCPVGRSRQCRIVSGSSANQSTRSRADHTPTLFTQPPRFVDELTSGQSVTTRAAASGAERVRSSRVRPSAACVVAVPDGVRPMSVGTDGTGGAGDTCSRRSRSPTEAHSTAAGDPSAKRAHGSSTDAPTAAASSAICSFVSSEEWFCGCPSLASP